MSSFIVFEPDYQFYLVKQDKTVYTLNTLVSCTASLTTNGVGQLTASFADPKGQIANLSGVKGQSTRPQAMDVVQLRLKNRHGEWGIAWTGYVDAFHQLFSAEQGDLAEIQASSPYKLWEVVRQNPGDTVKLSMFNATGITGSAVLTLTAQAVGYPVNKLVIDPQANSGSFLWGQISAAMFTNPDQQTWSAIIQPLAGDSGLEMFFDEAGICYWRRLGYLQDDPTYFMYEKFPRIVQEEEILQIDLAETDQGVVTEVEVRYGLIPLTQLAPYFSAPASMAQHLKVRRLVMYAPWIRGKEAAASLAQSMLNMYAANVLVGSVVIPADPLFRIGHLVDVPVPNAQQGKPNTPGLRAPLTTGRYYMGAVTYNLEWNGAWTMTLGLSYGRAADKSFPYVGSLTYPVVTQTIEQQFLSGTPVTPTSTQLLTPLGANATPGPYVVFANPSIKAALGATADTTISLDCIDLNIAAGSIVQLRDPATSAPIGPSPTGEYTVVDAGSGSKSSVTIASNPTGALAANVLIVAYYRSPAGYDSSNPGATSTSPTASDTSVTPTGDGSQFTSPTATPGGGMIFPLDPHYSITQVYGATDFAAEPGGHGFAHWHAGIDIGPTGQDRTPPIHAAAEGVVQLAGWDTTGYGNLTKILSGDLYHMYGHQSQIRVSPGDHVKAGQVIGYVGTTGNSSGNHLHFEIRGGGGTFGEDVDPTDYLPTGSVGDH